VIEIKVSEVSGVVVLHLTGRLGIAEGSLLKKEVAKYFVEEKHNIHINFQEVRFVNSSGLGALVTLMKEVRLRKGRLSFSNFNNAVEEIFEITQLSHIFYIFATQDEALKFHIPDTAKDVK